MNFAHVQAPDHRHRLWAPALRHWVTLGDPPPPLPGTSPHSFFQTFSYSEGGRSKETGMKR